MTCHNLSNTKRKKTACFEGLRLLSRSQKSLENVSTKRTFEDVLQFFNGECNKVARLLPFYCLFFL